MPVIRDDGTTDWMLLGQRTLVAISALVIASVLYLAGAWLVVMNTDLCPAPWQRLPGEGACISPK